MPHMEFLKELIPAFLGGSSKDESVHAEPDEQSRVAWSESMDGTTDDAGGKLGKRAREPEDQRPQSNKKSRRISEDEQRLTGRYISHPRDAKPIIMPGTNSNLEEVEWIQEKKAARNTGARMAPKPGAGSGPKFVNTLHQNQPGKTGSRGGPRASYNPPRFINAGSNSTKTAIRTPDNQNLGDGFDKSPSRARPKRQKTTGAPLHSNAQDPVVLVDDDDKFGEPHAVNGRPLSRNSSRSVVDLESQSQPRIGTQPFGAQEMRNVSQYTNFRLTNPRKKRNRPSSGQRSPSQSSHNQNGSSLPVRPGSSDTHRSGSLDDLKTPSELPPHITTSMSKREKHGKTDTPPVIELDKGFDEIKRHKDDHDVASLNGGIAKVQRKLGCSSNQQAPHTEQNAPNSKPPQPTPGRRRMTGSEAGEPSDGNMRHRFVRDVDSTPRSQHRSRPQMMEESSKTVPKTLNESPDPLLGQDTRRPGRSISSFSPRERSPSDMKRTDFTTSGQHSTTNKKKTGRTTKLATSEPVEDEIKIPIRSIFCRGCVLDTEVKDNPQWVDLVWSEEGHVGCFEVHRNGKPYIIPGKGAMMTIGKPESGVWHSGMDSTQVVLKGSMTSRSNGTILLSFLDMPGRNDCYRWLLHASGDTLKWQKEDRIEKMFKHMKIAVKTDASKERDHAEAKAKAAVLNHDRESRSQMNKRLPSEEHILFETSDHGDERQTSARLRVQANEQASSPAEVSPHFVTTDDQPTRKSTRQSKPVKPRSLTPPPPVERWTETHEFYKNNPPWPQSVMYPPSGAKRITVDFQDIERLDEGEFLNDNLVGYALRRIEENMAPEHRSKVHFFNSYFFTSLTTKNGRKAFNYDSVKKWTKQNDLFNVPYIVVPINENLHWYVAIICNLPNLARKVAGVSDDASGAAAATPSTSQQPSVRPSPIRDPDDAVVQDSQEPVKPDAQAMRDLSLNSDNDSQPKREEGSLIEFDANDTLIGNAQESEQEHAPTKAKAKQTGKKSKKRAPPPPRTYAPTQPAIITLDSFGVTHTPQVASLKNYVVAEAMDKRGMEVDREELKGIKAIGIPEQPNFCDCGLYLVGYVEEFAKGPEGFITKALAKGLNQENDFASFDPSAKRAEIRENLLELQKTQESERLAAKKAKKQDKDKVQVTAVNAPAQTSAIPAAAAVNSPAQTQGPALQSTEARSTAQASSSGPSRDASVKSERQPASVDPEATLAARESSKVPEASSSDVAIDSEHELEIAVPRPLSAGRDTAASITDQPTEPDRVTESAEAHAKDEDGEMLDNASVGEAQADYDAAQPPNLSREVLSPELDVLGQMLAHGLPPASREHEPAKSPV